MTDSEPIHKGFDDDLPGLLNEVDQVLRNADDPQLDNKIGHILARLETYNGLDNFQRLALQDLQDALIFRTLLSPKEYLTDVTPGTLLGHGNGCRVACVYEGRWKGERVAMKKFRSNKPADKPFLSFSRELNLWKEVSTCDGVWPLLGYTMWLDPDMVVVFALVSCLAEGNLGYDLSYLKSQIFAGYFYDVATGLKSIHNLNIIHGNIHPKNILKNNGRCHLTNFRLSESLNQEVQDSTSFRPMIAKALHDAPELIDGSQRHRNQKTDVYSFGSTMLKLLITWDWSRPPKRPSHLGPEWDAIWNIIIRCIAINPTYRPTASELVEQLESIKSIHLQKRTGKCRVV